MQKNAQKKESAYKTAMLLKYWKAATTEPIRDLCMMIAVYAQDVKTGLLYVVGYRAALTTDSDGCFKNIDTLSRTTLRNKDGKEALVKNVMNGSITFHAFLFENGTVRVNGDDEPAFDIALEPKVIAMNSGNDCESLFIVDAKMRTYKIKNKAVVRVTGFPDGIKIKDISCGDGFTVFLSECGRVFGMGLNWNGRLGLPHRIKKTEIPTEIAFPNQSDSDKNGIMVTMIHTSTCGWVAMDSEQRAWVIGEYLVKSVRSDYGSLNPCISVVEMWHANEIRITQVKCGGHHVIALDTEGRMYWFGKFNIGMLSNVSSNFIPFWYQITEIRSSINSVACKDAVNEWFVWGVNSGKHISGLCNCKTVCRGTYSTSIISTPMRCEWQGLFDATRVIDLQLGKGKAHVIVNTI